MQTNEKLEKLIYGTYKNDISDLVAKVEVYAHDLPRQRKYRKMLIIMKYF